MKKLSVLLLLGVGWMLVGSDARAEDLIPSEVIGAWQGKTEIFGPFKVEPYPSNAPEDHQEVVIVIASSGNVTGRIGGAEFKNCIVRRNRGWMGRMLRLKSEFIVSGGQLEGKITPRDKGDTRPFAIPFNIEDGKLTGTIMLLPKFPLTRPLCLEKDT